MSYFDCLDCHDLEQELKIARLMADTAYQRGREDAARDAAKNAELWSYTDEGIPSLVEAVYEAARGDLE